jgi:hypothetical protein
MICAYSPAGTEEIFVALAPGVPKAFESVAGAFQCIAETLPRFVNLSNWGAREFDVSRGADGGRKIFS